MLRVTSILERPTEARAALQARLQARREEIEQAVLARVFAVADPDEAPDPRYAEGLTAAVSAALDHGLAAVRLGEPRSPAPPPALVAQARLSARNGVALETVLRRYFAGYALLADFIVEEAEEGDPALSGPELQRLLRSQSTLLERIVAEVSEEHAREAAAHPRTGESRRAERVERLLAGELVDVAELPYDFDAHHVGLIASEARAADALRDLARDFDRRLLAVRREGRVWAWLGGREEIDVEELRNRAATVMPPRASVAIGEPARGLAGWRLTHQQARAALPIALRGSEPTVRYADVALLAAVLQDDLLATSLRELYLAPLRLERDGGEVLRETMRAYFAAQGNTSSAATALGVRRQTVTSRLRVIEETLGRDLSACAAEMEAALWLENMGTDHSVPSRRGKPSTLDGRDNAPMGEAV
jgi:GGDEF-like domain/PucR C-terminal helix-turn-helix domain